MDREPIVKRLIRIAKECEDGCQFRELQKRLDQQVEVIADLDRINVALTSLTTLSERDREYKAELVRQLESRLAAKCVEVDQLLEQRGNETLAILQFVARVNARAEIDILAGGPIEGAHHRAMMALLPSSTGGPVPE
jgi:translation initiation factor 1 (eIF-1/SUI1)